MPFEEFMYTSIFNIHVLSYFIFFIHLFTCAYIVWAISPHYPTPPPSPHHPSLLPDRNCSAFISNFVEESINNNKKDKAFLLVEIRIAI
jgi:hypothetical protein